MKPMPVIVGAPRSGTTLLRLMLDAHPELAIPPETGFLPSLCDLAGEGDALRTTFIETITRYPPESPGWHDFDISREALTRALAAVEPFTIADGVRAFYRLYAARFGKSRWGEKTPSYCLHLDQISRLLPEARFIHLIRDGRDVALSLRNVWFSPGNEIATLAEYWSTHVRAAMTSGARIAGYREVRYEELVRRPQSVLEELCEFLELPYADAMLQFHERAPQRLAEHKDRVWLDGSFRVSHEERLKQQRRTLQPLSTERVHSWRGAMSGDDILRFTEIAGALLDKLGYIRPDTATDVTRVTRPMRILLTIGFLNYRSGAELFVRDLAIGLQQRGHSVIVFSPHVGDIGDELRAECVSCVSALDLIAQSPEIIIGNTQHETVQALAQFPGVPAISICHDRIHPHGSPPHFSRIRRYVAVDANTRERLLFENGIAEDSIRMIQNGVDTRRFPARAPLPERPHRAAIFSNYATWGPETEAIRAACQERGIALDVIGKESGNQSREPAEVLPYYDIVFAKARCALEAMAVGCAVILVNEGMGMGSMVHSSRLAFLRQWNFGRRLLLNPITSAAVGEQIDRYDAADAQLICGTIRSGATLDFMVAAFSALAQEVVDEHASAHAMPPPPEQEWREFARYTRDMQVLGFIDQSRGEQLRLAERRFAERSAEAEQRIAALQATFAQQEQSLAQKVQSLELDAASEKARCSSLQDQHATALKHMEALRSSLSWRLTHPLRAIAALFTNSRDRDPASR